MHKGIPQARIPKPTPFVPDPSAFLTLIGRNTSAHASKFPTWDSLFTMSSAQMKDAGIEPPRARRYILWWRERFRNGITGIGGDLQNVQNGIAELRVVEVPTNKPAPATVSRDAGVKKVVVNVAPTVVLPEDPANPTKKEDKPKSSILSALAPPARMRAEEARPVEGVKIVQGNVIGGTGVEYVKGHAGVARLRVREGLWEQGRGHKVDGGERRRAEVRAKRRAAERKNAR
ncbi:hypothetical protein DOTSEDRAFT_75151 [Dothistroma septosporum NZE10]|uniref:Small ribosomal subunit protein mS41 n=1 Tax=Dothistroma septosporum (strain NZE10 / CBS 128990) TaxID=675120 RepID=M2WK73_DOTSN|nr:hypothetical protein DOTSEDRAFT_75151 [Dothistroma septosporum NZE10]